MKATDDAELKTQIDLLATLAVKGTGRKKADLLKAVEDAKEVDTIIEEIDDAAETATDNQKKAINAARGEGELKVIGMLNKTLTKAGFKEKITEINNELADKLAEHFKATQDDDGTNPGKKGEIEKLKNQIKTLENEKADLEEQHTLALAAKDAEVSDKALALEVKTVAKELLLSSNAVIPDDKDVATRKINRFIKDVTDGKYEKEEKGDKITFYLLGPDGKRVVEGGKRVTLESRVDEAKVDFFSLRQTQDKDGVDLPDNKGGGNQNKGAFKFDKYTGPIPKNEGEYLERVNDFTLSPEQRSEINTYWTTKPAEQAA